MPVDSLEAYFNLGDQAFDNIENEGDHGCGYGALAQACVYFGLGIPNRYRQPTPEAVKEDDKAWTKWICAMATIDPVKGRFG